MNTQLTTRVVYGARRALRGFSIIELLVALIIIGILVTIITPRLTDRVEEARRTRARQDLQEIQTAEEKVFIDIEYLVRLHVLDDIGGDGEGIPPQDPHNANDFLDALGDEDDPASLFALLGRQQLIFIDPSEINGGTPQPSLPNLYNQLVDGVETGFTVRSWHGPYLTYHVDQNSPTNPGEPTYIGDDPWGNDYLLFTRAGLMLEPEGEFRTTVTLNELTGGSGGATYDCLVFDRPTVLSLGANGMPGDGTSGPNGNFGRDDDLMRSF